MTTRILLGLALLCPMASWAQDKIPFDGRPGLWETTSTMEISGMPAMPAMDPETLKNMPPEARAQMEAMMKGRGMGSPRTQTVKSCMTKESFNKGFAVQDQNTCTRKVVSSTGSKMEIHMDCTQGKSKTTGDMTMERVDSEHAKGTMVMKTSEGGERSMDMKMSFSTKWLSSDCGDVKPVGEK